MDARSDTLLPYSYAPLAGDLAGVHHLSGDRRRPLRRLLTAVAAVLLLLAVAGFVLFYVSPDVAGNTTEVALDHGLVSLDNGFVHHVPESSRGVKEGVSEKTAGADVALRLGDNSQAFPWSNVMLVFQKTGFHFQPEKNWMNDPNGPVYYNGWYHLFYQYNPNAAVWGNISWGHAVSRDLLHWSHLPLAMVPDQWYDANGVWTGSATILPDGSLVMLYTGSTNASVQVQCLAYPSDPSDPLLIKWTKSDSNPVLFPPANIGLQDFRDPTTAWQDPSDDTWRVVIGSKDESHAGIAMTYKTKDFVHYELMPGLLHRVPDTGMWECIDFYPVGTRPDTASNGLDFSETMGPNAVESDGVMHVMKASMDDDRHDYYAIGRYDAGKNVWVPEEPDSDVGIGLRYDWGKFYASKTFYDPVKKRRILWGWIGETDSERADIAKGWASVMSVPRTVLFDVKTRSNLIQWPVEEVENLRRNRSDFSNITLDHGSVFQLDFHKATQLDIVAEFEIEKKALEATLEADVGYNCSTSSGAAGRGALGPFGLLVLADKHLQEKTAVYFYVSKRTDGGFRTHFCQDERRSSKANDIVKRVVGNTVPVLKGEKLQIRTLVDHSIVESFAQGGRSCITSRVYPTEAIFNTAGLYLFNNATDTRVTAKLTIWEMDSSNNRAYSSDH